MPEPQSPDKSLPVSSEAVREAQKQTEASNVELMDSTEARVPEDGQFFIKVGRENVNGKDNRALILKEPLLFADGYAYLILTRDGIKLLPVEHLYSYLGLPFRGYRGISLDVLLTGEPPSIHYSPGPEDGFSISPYGDKRISISVGKITRPIPIADSPSGTTEEGKRRERRILDDAIIKSINATRNQRKAGIPPPSSPTG